MIDVKDLRLGNFIQCDIWGEGEMIILQVSSLSNNGIYCYGHDGVFGGAEGIPITPEILESCGFKCDWWGHNGEKPVGSYYLAKGWVSVSDEMKVWSNHEE